MLFAKAGAKEVVDVSRAIEVHALVQKTVAKFGRLDVAFNKPKSKDLGLHRRTIGDRRANPVVDLFREALP